MLSFKQTHLVSCPLNGVLDDRRERLESAEWDLLFWGVPLISKGKDLYRSNVKTKLCVSEAGLVWERLTQGINNKPSYILTWLL